MATQAWEALSTAEKRRLIRRYMIGPFRKYWWQFWRPKPPQLQPMLMPFYLTVGRRKTLADLRAEVEAGLPSNESGNL